MKKKDVGSCPPGTMLNNDGEGDSRVTNSKGAPYPEVEVAGYGEVIKPLSKGGDNSFNNLVPLIQPDEHQPFTNWWRNFP